MRSLPYLGLGLSSNAQAGDSPNPYTLREQHPDLVDYVEYSAPLDIEEAKAQATLFPTMLAKRAEVPLLFHPVHVNLWGPELESAERLAQCAAHVSAVGSPWVSNDVGWWHSQGTPFPGYLYLTPPLTPEGLALSVTHARHVGSAMPVPLLLENPVVMTARGSLHVLDFMDRLSSETGCHLLVDLGHLLSHQLSRGVALTEGLAAFPWARVLQLHLAGGALSHRGGRGVYVDDHTQPVRDEVFSLLNHVLPLCTNLRALTFEGDGHAEALAVQTLQRLRAVLPRQTRESFTVEVSPGEATEVTAAQRAQCESVFTEVYAGRCPEDALGAVAELDYRLAVLAEHLDAEVPLTRLAFAPGREELLGFAQSTAFRERGAADALLTWARSRSRELQSPGAEMLLAFETWARGLLRRAPPSGAVKGAFPSDLSEVLHSYRAMKRHFQARAPWSAGGFEGDGLRTLLALAERAPRGPWMVTLRAG